MITTLDSPAVASAQWSDVVNELDRWRAEGRMATLWWRDDDAVAPSRRLDELVSVADEAPVALAVIPAGAGLPLARWLERSAPASVRILQHGWRHANHGAGGKKSEFPNSRPREVVVAELAAGRARLSALFGSRALAVLAPPWNRFDNAFMSLLAEAGIAAVSKITPRPTPYPQPGVLAVNTHVDLIDWRGNRGFVGEAVALGEFVRHLRARRCGDADADEPTGILTHHLVQDEATGAFLSRLIELTRGHAAARWLDAAQVFALSNAGAPVRGRA